MKKRILRTLGLAAGLALSLSAFAACGTVSQGKEPYDSSVVKAFYAVTPTGDVVSQTAEADGENNYRVTVITPSSVYEYGVDAQFKAESPKTIFGAARTAVEEETGNVSDLERAFEEAVKRSGIPKADVEGFDFDKDTYMGDFVFKVEIEDASAKYSYIFKADDLSLLESKVELKNTQPESGESSYIGEERAKEIAFEAVGIEESQAANFTLKSILSNGKKIYKAAFDYDGYRYRIDMDALSGDIVRFSKNILDENVQNPDVSGTITEERAKEIALAFAFPDGVGDTQVVFRKVKLDYEGGQFIYEVEFVAGGSEYDFEISAADGRILDVEIDVNGEDRLPQGDTFLTREQAIRKVLDEVGSEAFILNVDVEKEYVNGELRYFYEIEVKVGNVETEYRVDAVTGEVTENEENRKEDAGSPLDPAFDEKEALRIALEDFNLTEDQLTSQRVKLEWENGRLCYEIKLRVGKDEYSMTIDAQNGTILEREIELGDEEDVPPQGGGQTETPPQGGGQEEIPPQGGGQTDKFLTEEEAVAALKRTVKGIDRIGEIEFEYSGTGANRRYYYEIEAYIGGRKYEYYVDAMTGEVRGERVDEMTLIGEEKAIEIALGYFSVAGNEARCIEVELEKDNGILQYEVEFEVRDLEYTVEIDAITGVVLRANRSYD